jgi:hypothetical protein
MASLLGNNLIEMRNELESELMYLASQLVPFDKVYDEDFLEAKEYQFMLISNEIDNLELDLFMTFDSKLRIKMVRKTEAFTKKFEDIEKEIKLLRQDRYDKHEAWKAEYLENIKSMSEIKTKIDVIDTFVTVLEICKKKRTKLSSKNAMTLCSLHSEFNNILQMLGYKKQGAPYTSFRMAYKNKLISENTYIWLTS